MSSIRSVFNFKVFWQNFRSAQGLLLVAMIIYQAGILINCFRSAARRTSRRSLRFPKFQGSSAFWPVFCFPSQPARRCLIFFSARRKVISCFPRRFRVKTLYGSNWAGGMLFPVDQRFDRGFDAAHHAAAQSQLIVENGVVIRFLILWGLSMMMVYSFCCLAVSLTGNRFVQFVLVAVLTLLPGWFHYTFQTQFYNYDQLSQTEFS